MTRKMRLCQINLKHKKDLQGIQLCFTNGVESPLFESDAAADLELERYPINSIMRVKKLSYSMSEDRKRIEGIAMHTRGGTRTIELLSQNWSQADPQWTSMELPQAKEIIGVYGTREADAITSFGFVVAVPNYAAKK